MLPASLTLHSEHRQPRAPCLPPLPLNQLQAGGAGHGVAVPAPATRQQSSGITHNSCRIVATDFFMNYESQYQHSSYEYPP